MNQLVSYAFVHVLRIHEVQPKPCGPALDCTAALRLRLFGGIIKCSGLTAPAHRVQHPAKLAASQHLAS